MKNRYADEQINAFLKPAAGTPIKDICGTHGFSDTLFQLWRRKFGSMEVLDAHFAFRRVPCPCAHNIAAHSP